MELIGVQWLALDIAHFILLSKLFLEMLVTFFSGGKSYRQTAKILYETFF